MEWITGAVMWVWSNMAIVLEVVGAAAILATYTKNTADDAAVAFIYKLINFVGQNYGKAANNPAEK